MSVHPVIVELPEEIYKRVERTAQGLRQSIEHALIKIVETGLPSLAKIPPAYRPELEAMEIMSDNELWKIARSEMPGLQQDRLDDLLRKSQAEGLNEIEQLELDRLHDDVNRLTIRKSYAYVLLKWRGYQIPKLISP
jgi:hypothetical protein